MKGALFTTTLILSLFFLSCQKEIDWGLGGGGTGGTRLVKIIQVTGTDTVTTLYSYDASKKLVREKITGMSSGTDVSNDLFIIRNANGIITKTIQKAPALIAGGIDSVETRYNYNTSTSQYTSAVFALGIVGFSVTDSAVYTYDANGKIISDAHYLQAVGLPIPPFLGLKNNYSYSAAGTNLVSLQQDGSTTPGGPLSPVSSQTFTFDAKTNALTLFNEAIILGRTGFYNINNVTNLAFTNTANPANDFTLDYVYKYNSKNRPDSAYMTKNPGATLTAVKYFYQ